MSPEDCPNVGVFIHMQMMLSAILPDIYLNIKWKLYRTILIHFCWNITSVFILNWNEYILFEFVSIFLRTSFYFQIVINMRSRVQSECPKMKTFSVGSVLYKCDLCSTLPNQILFNCFTSKLFCKQNHVNAVKIQQDIFNLTTSCNR